ncbi:hypothetical protein BSTEL_1423 [Bifidobacterium stellenboschense]|uniref:CTP synthase n=2 Tax=Bifidobacterium stellenboschense TaxID=762211 RepID=A0A087E0J3_9BIFI|nr:hypothetical protein BSTEL_1423 [Bifidobacterium stellenboschense]
MKQHKVVNARIVQAQQENRCAVGDTDALRRAMRRRVATGELASPYQNLYVPPDYWAQLNECQRSLHVARGLARLHPTWVFAGITAADVHGFEHSWKVHDQSVYVANAEGRKVSNRSELSRRMPGEGYRRSSRSGADGGRRFTVRRLYVPSIAPVSVNGIMVTDAARTLIDCGLSLPFRFALPMFDSAARKGMDMNEVERSCKGLHDDRAPIEMLLRYVDAASENGGESMVRAFIIDNGFVVPELQVEFHDPAYPVRRYRVDFLWRLHDGRMIVLEYDGMAKYENPAMTRGRTAKQILNERNERDRVLRAAGVTTILHCTYEDAFASNRLFMMLGDNAVPRTRAEGAYC